jgi:hypothetical protein
MGFSAWDRSAFVFRQHANATQQVQNDHGQRDPQINLHHRHDGTSQSGFRQRGWLARISICHQPSLPRIFGAATPYYRKRKASETFRAGNSLGQFAGLDNAREAGISVFRSAQ